MAKNFTRLLTIVCVACLINPLASGGCSPPTGMTTVTHEIGVTPATLSAESGGHDLAHTADRALVDPGGWLTIGSLRDLLTDLQSEAGTCGYAAAWRQPDPDTGQSFLIAASGQAGADSLNGFFFWLLDPAASQGGNPELVLCIDRLFSDESRETAMAGDLFSEPRAVCLLDFSMRQVLGHTFEPTITDFILARYRQDFQNRLNDPEPSLRIGSQVFTHLEVIYETSISSTISFRPLIAGSGMAAPASRQARVAYGILPDRPDHANQPCPGVRIIVSRYDRCACAALRPANI